MAYITSDDYKNIIYSGQAQNVLKILFNGVEYQNIDDICESFTVTSRILPNDGKKIFSLNNFVCKEATLILHNINLNDIIEPIDISIGTMVNGNYEYVPIGTFYVQDNPTTDNDKTTIKLRDSAIKFDFNYNAKQIIDDNGGYATKLQILQDICSKAGVSTTITTFLGYNDFVGIYDNTITARTYISYLAEQAGAIATINREGKLTFVYLNNLAYQDIPLEIVEKFTIGEPYKIEKVIFDNGLIKYQKSSDNPTSEENLSILYLSASNPYITNQSQIDSIFLLVNTFDIDSVTTGKIIGNPAIDSYDIIRIIDTQNNNTVVLKTLANNTLKYTGICTSSYTTEIGKEERTTNTTISGEATYKKLIRTEIDNINASLSVLSEETNELGSKYTEVKQTADSLTTTVQGIQENGVEKVSNTMVTIDINGISVQTNTSAIKTTMTNNEFKVVDSGGTKLAYFGYDEELQQSVGEMDNLTIKTYFTAGVHRVETYEEDGEERTGWFYVGGN